MSQTMTLIEFRDALLESLRVQCKAKVVTVQYRTFSTKSGRSEEIDGLLIDLANNIAQSFADGLEVK
jgi:hypothetical protein